MDSMENRPSPAVPPEAKPQSPELLTRRIEGAAYSADIVWDKGGRPVIYVIGKGRLQSPTDALACIAAAVEMINASAFDHVCAVYNVLGVTQLPMLARFIGPNKFPSSPKTAHIIVGTHNQAIQMVASLAAVLGSRRLRTMEACRSEEEIEAAVKRWMALGDHARSYTINDV